MEHGIVTWDLINNVFVKKVQSQLSIFQAESYIYF
jgi:hypothetical protein